jgi:hypothetical protein
MKKIIICADGTWQSPESDSVTHILRIARGIAPEDADGNKQIVFYDWGVGSSSDTLTGGITGKGIDKNILDCYRFLVHNYNAGDQLYLFGFSRGAYTVRSLGDYAGQWLAREAEQCGLTFEPHVVDDLAPDHTGPLHNEYKGFYRVLRRRIVREVEPVVHISVRHRWQDHSVRYSSPALMALLARVNNDWERVRVVE